MSKKNQEFQQCINILETIHQLGERIILHKTEIHKVIIDIESLYKGLKTLQSWSFDKPIIYSYIQSIHSMFNEIMKKIELKEYNKINKLFENELTEYINQTISILSENIKEKDQKILGIMGSADLMFSDQYIERSRSLHEQGEKIGFDVLFFSIDAVDMDNNKIFPAYQINGTDFQEVEGIIPDVIHNFYTVGLGEESSTETELRKRVPFTSVGTPGKRIMNEMFMQNDKTTTFFIPYKTLRARDDLYTFLETDSSAVIKPVKGTQGKGIIYIKKESGKYFIYEHETLQKMNHEEFLSEVIDKLIASKETYIVQKFVRSETKNGEARDFRAHYQKNGSGQWELTKMYPRIGSNKTILSNISQGGRTEEIIEFLKEEYGSNSVELFNHLHDIGLQLVMETDELFSYGISELGVDLTIDENEKIWVFEIQGGPQSKFHEYERAEKMVAYAQYLMENGIYHKEKIAPLKTVYFNQKDSKLPYYDDSEKRPLVGVMVPRNKGESDFRYGRSVFFVAYYYGINSMMFSPEDVDIQHEVIRAWFFNGVNWQQKVVRYPDMICDRISLNNDALYNYLNNEFSNCVFANDLTGSLMNQMEIYQILGKGERLQPYLLPYKKINRMQDVFEFLDYYGEIIVKPSVGSYGGGVTYITKGKNNQLVVYTKEEYTKKNYREFKTYLEPLINEKEYLVQQFISFETIDKTAFDIRVHLVKNSNQAFEIAVKQPRIGYQEKILRLTRHGGYISQLEGFIKRNFPQLSYKEFVKSVNKLSEDIAITVDKEFNKELSEMALDIGVDKHGNLYLIEVNLNKPGINYYEFEVVQKMLGFLMSKYRAKTGVVLPE